MICVRGRGRANVPRTSPPQTDPRQGKPMRNLDENTITAEALDRIANTPDMRLKEITTALIKHLHAFAREVELTEEEWLKGIGFLTATGHITGDKRQEFILLSDTLGLSTLVIAQNNRKPKGCTEATVIGPFHVVDAPHFALGADLANGAIGEPCFVQGKVCTRDGLGIPAAVIEVWQADADGFYDVQYQGNDSHRARGVLQADDEGRFYFKSVLPEPYPIPTDGPVGRMLDATARHPMRPAHMHFIIEAPGYERLVTHVFRNGDRYLDSDAVFGVRSSLISDWEHHEPGTMPDGTWSVRPFYTLDFDFIMNAVERTGSGKAIR
jgi:hydroxyquinol 1,2-dioxygenase